MSVLTPQFFEQPAPGRLHGEVDGSLSVPRQFGIVAVDSVTAWFILRNNGFTFGAPYITNGKVLSAALKISDIDIQPHGRELIGDPDNVYTAKLRYETDKGGKKQDKNGLELTPDGPPHFSSEQGMETIPADTDTDGGAIVNTAQVPYDPPVQIPSPTEFLIAEWIDSNTLFQDAVIFARRFVGRTNSSSWKGASEENVLCHTLLPKALDNAAFAGGGLVKFTGRFQFRDTEQVGNAIKQGFQISKLNTGKLERDPDRVGQLRPITVKDKDGRPVQVSNDVFLNQSGRVETGGDEIVNVFSVIKKIDLNQILRISP